MSAYLENGEPIKDYVEEKFEFLRFDILLGGNIYKPKPVPPRIAIVKDLSTFLSEKIPPNKFLLDPFLTDRSIGMVHAWRGVGKTHTLMGMAVALATGGQFWRWSASEPVPVMYIDGEMIQQDLQQWLNDAVRLGNIPVQPGMFTLIGSDFEEYGIPSLMGTTGQDFIMNTIERLTIRPRALFIDNISSLFRRDDPEQDEWDEAQAWLLQLRRLGFSTVMAHHDGKNLTQRGASKREDVMNWVIHLKHPAEYEAEEGLRAEVKFEKARGVFGSKLRPFEAKLTESGWEIQDCQDVLTERILEMKSQGSTVRQIAADLKAEGHKIGKTKVSDLINAATFKEKAAAARAEAEGGSVSAPDVGF